MISEPRLLESNALRNLQKLSEARGLKFYVNPPREIAPDFLGDYQPDAIALGPEGGMIIELKLRRSPASEKQLAAIASRVSDQKGWEFRAIYLNPPLDEMPPIEKPTPDQLQGTFREIEELTKTGHRAAAFVRAWAALESLARLASANGETRSARGLPPIQVVQTLAEEGYVENEVADRLRQMVKLRNAVVHGDFTVDVPVERIEDLLKQLQAIASDITSTNTNADARDQTQSYLPSGFSSTAWRLAQLGQASRHQHMSLLINAGRLQNLRVSRNSFRMSISSGTMTKPSEIGATMACPSKWLARHSPMHSPLNR